MDQDTYCEKCYAWAKSTQIHGMSDMTSLETASEFVQEYINRTGNRQFRPESLMQVSRKSEVSLENSTKPCYNTFKPPNRPSQAKPVIGWPRQIFDSKSPNRPQDKDNLYQIKPRRIKSSIQKSLEMDLTRRVGIIQNNRFQSPEKCWKHSTFRDSFLLATKWLCQSLFLQPSSFVAIMSS